MKTLLLVALLVLVSCGSDQPGNKDAYQGSSSNCSAQFVNDYNGLANKARNMTTVGDVKAFRSAVESFKSRYEGVRCEASVEGKRETIDASQKSEDILKKIDEALAKARN